MARLFIGIEIDDAVRAAAAAAAARLRDLAGPDVGARWIPPQNLHITIWFIGEVDDRRAAQIISALDRPFDTAAFDLTIGGAGAFPPSGAPRIFWLGVRAGAEAAVALYAEVGARLAPLGIQPERRAYAAHLTVARVKEARRRGGYAGLRAALHDAASEAGTCRVDAVTLFRSHLSPKGAAYESLLRVPLS